MRLIIALLFLLGSTFSIAKEIEIQGTMTQTVNVRNNNKFQASRSVPKTITFMKLKISDSGRQKVIARAASLINRKPMFSDDPLVVKEIQLGMGSVPVLDQGNFGTCVTFAVTAAIDAVLEKGDYISQTCHLQLGRYLEMNGYNPSGWEGSFGHMVLSQIEAFGVMNKSQEQSVGCGGIHHYPTHNFGNPISVEEFHALSEPLDMEAFAWSPLLDVYQVFLDKTDTQKLLNQVKLTLLEGDRIPFGTLLPGVSLGVLGALGKNKVDYDTWVLTPEIAKSLETETDLAGHEMIITGYNDNAVAVDDKGHEHKGLLTLRNSWGTDIGDKGDFYMSYDYFKTMVMEAYRIRQLSHIAN